MTFENTTVVLNILNYPVHQVTWVNTAVAPNTQVGRHIASLKFYILNWKVNFLVASKACVPLHSCFKLLIQLKVSVFSSCYRSKVEVHRLPVHHRAMYSISDQFYFIQNKENVLLKEK